MSLSTFSYGDERLSKDYIYKMQSDRLATFKSQDLEKGHFDVIFDIEGKKLHAHKFILTSVSETLNSWLADRWTKKDDIIKIETYSYNCFYEFLCFIYSGSCNLTNENIFEIVDIAEFFAVSCLKEFCDKFLFKNGKITVENVGEMYDFAEKYSLPEFKDIVKEFVVRNGSYCEELFEAVYKWAEQQIVEKQKSVDENCSLQEAVKNELNTILPNIEFHKMGIKFLTDSVVKKGIYLSPTDFSKLYQHALMRNDFISEEILLLRVQLLSMYQSTQKIQNAPKDAVCLSDGMKFDLCEIIQHVKLYRIKKESLMDLLVKRGLLSEEQMNCALNTRFQIQNGFYKITGTFMDDYGIRRAFDAKGSEKTTKINSKTLQFYNVKIRIPSTPSAVKKSNGYQWYLCLDKDGIVAIKHYSLIYRTDYLIAKMNGDLGFHFNNDYKPQIYFSTNE